MINTNKTHRSLKLLELLTTNNTLPMKEVADLLDCSLSTIYRLVAELNEEGFELKADRSTIQLVRAPEWCALMPGRSIRLTQQEALDIYNIVCRQEQAGQVPSNLRQRLYLLASEPGIRQMIHPDQSATLSLLIDGINRKRCVLLKGYRSSNSGTCRDRHVEPISFAPNYRQVACVDLDDHNRVKWFALQRITQVELLSKPWRHPDLHLNPPQCDLFWMSGPEEHPIQLTLTQRAYNMLVEGHPLVSTCPCSKLPDNRYLVEMNVRSVYGIGHFLLGLPLDAQVSGWPELHEYLLKTHQAGCEALSHPEPEAKNEM